jgi:D-alanine-D-alanine ligase
MPRPSRTLGPLPDLEPHLPVEWWRTLFNANYLKTDGDVVENADNTTAEVDLLVRAAGLEPGQKILDLCCGQGRHTLELAARGFRQARGIDQSRYLLGVARKRAKAAGLPAKFTLGEARELKLPPGQLDCIAMMGNSFGYFQHADDDLVVLQAVRRALKANGTLAMDLTDGDWVRKHYEPRSWEWLNAQELVVRERQLSADGQRLVCREVIVHATRGITVDQFYAERLYDREQVANLLTRAGFTGIAEHDVLEAASSRDQDLGMMAHRVFITARVAEHAQQMQGQVEKQRLTVLLGDPRLPDPVKRDGTFNPEDFEVINRLKHALSDWPDVTVRYVDRHAHMMQAIAQDDSDLVINFCDEGLTNDPSLELHVPALLEIYRRPYTGAGPTCLGLCFDKAHVRAIAASMGVPVPREAYVAPSDPDPAPALAFPAIVKPNHGDGSLGIPVAAVVHNVAEMRQRIKELRAELPDRGLIVQEFLPGAEYSVGLIGNPGFSLQPLPILEVDYRKLPKGAPQILGYESKWHPESPYWTDIRFCQAQLEHGQRQRLVQWSARLFERLGCRDYARFDFRTGADGEIKLLEVNPNPGWCWDGKFNMMAEWGGWSYSDLLRAIVDAACQRLGLPTSQPAEVSSQRVQSIA